MTEFSMDEKVRQIAADVFNVPVAQITLQSSPENIETWDSIQNLNLLLALEQAFGLQFEPEEIDRMKTIQEIIGLLVVKQKNSI